MSIGKSDPASLSMENCGVINPANRAQCWIFRRITRVTEVSIIDAVEMSINKHKSFGRKNKITILSERSKLDPLVCP